MDMCSVYSESIHLGSKIEGIYKSYQYMVGPCAKVTKKNGQS